MSKRMMPFRFTVLAAALIASGAGAHAQQPTPQKLTLKDAIALALKNNLSVRVAGTQISEAAGTTERRHSVLLPHASGDALTNRKSENLAVAGISAPGFPMVVGPFSYYDFRVSGQQSLYDPQSYHNWKASQKQEQATRLDYQDTRDLVIRQAAGFYLDGETAAAEVQAAGAAEPGK